MAALPHFALSCGRPCSTTTSEGGISNQCRNRFYCCEYSAPAAAFSALDRHEIAAAMSSHRFAGQLPFFRDTQSNAGAPYMYVTTPDFLSAFGTVTLRDLPNVEALEWAN
ncbi:MULTISPECIES: hypothetical protein [Rhizobium]|uniref:Uncharacterized protein n=1 Tax=Rhizobium rhododendri TaxID=2506430 RepID=A0ABY8IRT3_9HYPH|nr:MULTISPECIES: hypothetical protein [Rhizobium]WFS26289.1 hypothetical protein PR018_24990 [Rhizobium rhododendri]